jgi:hypothetical protein
MLARKAGRHEPYESRGSRADLWGPEAATPPATRRLVVWWQGAGADGGWLGKRERARRGRGVGGWCVSRRVGRPWDLPGPGITSYMICKLMIS